MVGGEEKDYDISFSSATVRMNKDDDATSSPKTTTKPQQDEPGHHHHIKAVLVSILSFLAFFELGAMVGMLGPSIPLMSAKLGE